MSFVHGWVTHGSSSKWNVGVLPPLASSTNSPSFEYSPAYVQSAHRDALLTLYVVPTTAGCPSTTILGEVADTVTSWVRWSHAVSVGARAASSSFAAARTMS